MLQTGRDEGRVQNMSKDVIWGYKKLHNIMSKVEK